MNKTMMKCIRPFHEAYPGLTKDKAYEVESKGTGWVYVTLDTGKRESVLADRFEAIGEFKAGDKVTFKADQQDHIAYGKHVGKTLTVKQVEPRGHGEGPLVHFEGNECAGAFAHRLELVKVYKAGDKVRIVKVEPAWEGLLDAVCEVLENDGSTFRPLKLKTDGWRHPVAWMKLSEVEPAGDVKPYQKDPAVELKSGDFAVYIYSSKPFPAQITGQGTYYDGEPAYKADFWNVGNMARVSNLFPKAYFRPATPAELRSTMFDVFKPKAEKPKFKHGDWVKASMHRKGLGSHYGKDWYTENLRYGTFSKYHTDSDKIVMTGVDGLTYTMWLDTCEHVTASEIAQMPKSVSSTVTKSKGLPMRQKFIIVLMDKFGRLQPSANPYTHLDRASAETEAKRLAETTTVPAGSTFVIFEGVSKAVPPVPTKAQIVGL